MEPAAGGYRSDPESLSRALSIPREAADLYVASDVVDLHVDSYIWTRVFGYDLLKRNGPGVLGARFWGQADVPRLVEAGLTGAIWAITTNPLRSASGRAAAFERNVRSLQRILLASPDVAVVRSYSEYAAARAAGKHAAFVGIQGGNALDFDESTLDRIPDDVVIQVTPIHLTSSGIGGTSSPLGRGRGLSDFGRQYVRRLEEKRILVDLAHASKRAFWDAVEVHDRSIPLVVTHTGVSGAHPHWRNLDDDQLRAIADSGGTVGIMYQSSFLGDSPWGGRAESIVRHLEHVVATIGEDHASLGSDWDGAIVTPRDLPTCLELPRLAALLLARGWSAGRIQKVLGGNFLRVLRQIRP